MKFFLPMDPPTVTAQMRRVTYRNGRPMFYKSKALKDAQTLFTDALRKYRPDDPIEGPICLMVVWYFPTKSHKECEWRTTRPDTDNLQKLLKDCMTDVGYWKDDAQVCGEVIKKVWTRTRPGISISVTRFEEDYEG